ncbi:O-antigen ligase family protein, partial [Sulfurimonas sp.]|uniref:O-antigen ligase family protein n=1 Tax=Sulfurimonas sp. TaxID=2022749 RepID=UPI002604F52D
KKHPLFGVGTGDSMDEIERNVPKKYSGIHAMPHEHNQFLSVFVSLGIVGLLFFLNIYYQIFKYNQPDKELRFIMIFSTLAVTFGILTTQFNLRFFMPLWIVMLSITMIDKKRRTISADINDKRVNKEIVITAILVFVCVSILKYKLH